MLKQVQHDGGARLPLDALDWLSLPPDTFKHILFANLLDIPPQS
jgi:hypothetical protein